MLKKYKNLKKFNKYFKKYKIIIIKLIIVMILASSLGMILPYLYSKRLIGITDIDIHTVLLFSVLILLTILIHHINWYLWEKYASVLTNKVAFDIRKNIINYFINTKYSITKIKNSGYFLERINDDTTEVASTLPNLLGTIVDCITNFSFLIFIYYLNWQCGLIFSIGIIVLFILDLIKIKVDLKYTEKLKQLSEKFNTKINEIHRGIKEIKGIGIESYILENTNITTNRISEIQVKKDKYIALLSRFKTFSQYVLEVIIVIYSIKYLIPQNGITIVGLLMVMDYSGFMYDLVGYIAKMKECLTMGDFKASRILDILDSNKLQKYGDIDEVKSYDIEVKNLNYSYENNKLILKDINLYIKENTINLFIGKSGSGKSTLFSVLSKILEVENNKIFIGNTDINMLSEKFFENNICIINQEPFLLNESIMDNLKIVRNNISNHEIYEACKMANIHDDIMNLEEGYNTVISENSNNLSGGQKQRISIARAILKNSSILLFDEPTSALDKQNEELFYKTINSLKSNKTILIISHKYDNIRNLDNIYEIKNGIMNIKERVGLR